LVCKDTEIQIPPFPAQVADTVGAGDSFNAGFAFALAEGKSAAEAVLWGNAAGSLSTRTTGAQGALATRAEVESLVIARSKG
jgi:ribokinase